MKQLTLLIKPASGLCNMRCQYCFYEDVSSHRAEKNRGILPRTEVDRLLAQAFTLVEPGENITFLFQGGEPTLAGLDFFRYFLEQEARYADSGISVNHAIQTNGFCLDENWAAFLRENQFLVGLSLDGLPQLQDEFRRDATGNGTWARTVTKLKLLDSFQIETNLLCVVTGRSAKKANQIYRTLTQLGHHPLQFIPCLDPLEAERGHQPYSLTPEGYGTFLCQLFDCWYRDWKQGHYVSIRNFDDYLRHLLRLPPSSCAAAGSCGHYLVVEGDGSLYPCDYYVLDHWCLGNIQNTTLEQALHSETAAAFLMEGRQRPALCATCRYGLLCRGGCKRDWDSAGNHYYCAAFRRFFAYSLSRLEEMATTYRYF